MPDSLSPKSEGRSRESRRSVRLPPVPEAGETGTKSAPVSGGNRLSPDGKKQLDQEFQEAEGKLNRRVFANTRDDDAGNNFTLVVWGNVGVDPVQTGSKNLLGEDVLGGQQEGEKTNYTPIKDHTKMIETLKVEVDNPLQNKADQSSRDAVEKKADEAAARIRRSQKQHGNPLSCVEAFRDQILLQLDTPGYYVIVSYARQGLRQSPSRVNAVLGGYDKKYEMVLILDNDKAQYPCHWVPTSALFRAIRSSMGRETMIHDMKLQERGMLEVWCHIGSLQKIMDML